MEAKGVADLRSDRRRGAGAVSALSVTAAVLLLAGAAAVAREAYRDWCDTRDPFVVVVALGVDVVIIAAAVAFATVETTQ